MLTSVALSRLDQLPSGEQLHAAFDSSFFTDRSQRRDGPVQHPAPECRPHQRSCCRPIVPPGKHRVVEMRQASLALLTLSPPSR